MRIAVDTIPRPGRVIDLALREDWARDAARAALDAEPSSLSGTLDLSSPRRQRMVTVSADVAVAAEVACARCGETTRFELATQAPLSYMPAADPASGEVELVEEELDVGWYSQGEIDLADVLREAIALAVPTRYTCADTEACDARTRALLAEAEREAPAGHPGFAVLKQLKN